MMEIENVFYQMEEALNQLKNGGSVIIQANDGNYRVARGDLIHPRTIEDFFCRDIPISL